MLNSNMSQQVSYFKNKDSNAIWAQNLTVHTFFSRTPFIENTIATLYGYTVKGRVLKNVIRGPFIIYGREGVRYFWEGDTSLASRRWGGGHTFGKFPMGGTFRRNIHMFISLKNHAAKMC